MKKIISGVLFIIFFWWISLWYTCMPRPECNDPLYEWEVNNMWIGEMPQWWEWDVGECPWSPWCPWYDETINTTTNDWNSTWAMGISCNEDQLVNGQCKLNIYDTLGIRQSVRNEWDPTSVGLFVQDVVLSATMFIGTLVTVALIVSGLMFIFAASSGKDPANAKKWIMGSLVGLLIVVSSYVIIRLVQYIAKWF